jgi:hypothetical protein
LGRYVVDGACGERAHVRDLDHPAWGVGDRRGAALDKEEQAAA